MATLVKNILPPLSHGLCKAEKFFISGGCKLVAHGPNLAHRCILFSLYSFKQM